MIGFHPNIVFDLGVIIVILATGIGYIQRVRRKRRQIRFSIGLEVETNPWVLNYALDHFNHENVDTEDFKFELNTVSFDAIENHRSELFLLDGEETEWVIRYYSGVNNIMRKLEKGEHVDSADLLRVTFAEALLIANFSETEQKVDQYQSLLKEATQTESHVFPNEAENMLEEFESGKFSDITTPILNKIS